MAKLNKTQTVYVAMRERGYTHDQAVSLASQGPGARSRYKTFWAFITWAKAWDAEHAN